MHRAGSEASSRKSSTLLVAYLAMQRAALKVCQIRTSRLAHVRAARECTFIAHSQAWAYVAYRGKSLRRNHGMFGSGRIAWDSEPRSLSLTYLPEGCQTMSEAARPHLPDAPHGTLAGYRMGCRCQCCQAANHAHSASVEAVMNSNNQTAATYQQARTPRQR